ncbi:MAG TPA: hypothetical protein EYH35_01435, partial [Thiotrichaceae bacterium]|nr:hypothetical protein [Thiotrichaceae bacterium]
MGLNVAIVRDKRRVKLIGLTMFLKTIVIFLLLNLMIACSSKKSNDSSSGVVEPVQLIDLSLDGNTPALTVLQEVDYSFDPIVENIENIHFTVQNMPNWISFDPNTGRLWGKPNRDDVGVYRGIVITAYDNKGNAQSFPSFELTVEFVNTAPVISGTPSPTINQKSAYYFETQASDVDNDALTYSMVNSPSWLSINTTTGVVSGTPAQADVGTSEGIVITVTDAEGATASLPAFDLTVINVNDAPTIEGTPITSILEG